jgi:hypothetical protein
VVGKATLGKISVGVVTLGKKTIGVLNGKIK